jgi:uncharacterized repeat protein (TIGR01451 family)
MKALLLGVLMAMSSALSTAGTFVLDPGPGTDYLGVWCGGQTVNEIATGFDAATGNAQTLVKVATTCHGSGRGSPNQYYLACWTVGFARDATIATKLFLATNHWVQGQPAIPCPVPADTAAVYTATDGAGNFPATLSTTLVGTSSSAYRAVLETTCDAIHFGDSVAGTISAPGVWACDSFAATAGNGVRASATATSGSLLPAVEIRRPDGSIACSSPAGSAACSLATSGLYTVVVHDATGSGTGSYLLSLARTDVPHLTIAMTGTPTSGRLSSTISYQITINNDGGAAATAVVMTDTLPQGLSVRNMSATQGSCSRSQRAVTCTLGDLPAAASAVVTIVASTGLSSGQVTNTACVDPATCATTTTTLP